MAIRERTAIAYRHQVCREQQSSQRTQAVPCKPAGEELLRHCKQRARHRLIRSSQEPICENASGLCERRQTQQSNLISLLEAPCLGAQMQATARTRNLQERREALPPAAIAAAEFADVRAVSVRQSMTQPLWQMLLPPSQASMRRTRLSYHQTCRDCCCRFASQVMVLLVLISSQLLHSQLSEQLSSKYLQQKHLLQTSLKRMRST